jgi:hypothetical protein
MEKWIMRVKVLKIVWIFCSVALLVVSLAYTSYAPERLGDVAAFLLLGMLFLAFPVSFLVVGLCWLPVGYDMPPLPVWLLLELTEGSEQGLLAVKWLASFAETDQGLLTIMWLSFFVAGYLQWFVLVPWLWRKCAPPCPSVPVELENLP